MSETRGRYALKYPRVVLDIETEANPEALALLPEPKAPATYKDPEKIAAFIAEKRSQQVAEAALDPDTGIISAIGLQEWPVEDNFTDEDDGENCLMLAPERELACGEYDSEAEMLAHLWAILENFGGRIVGFNIIGFDLPYIMRRSMALGIKPPFVPNLARYRCEPITDLYALLYNWGPGKGLKTVAKMYGIPNPLPDLDGSQYAGMEPEKRRAYVMNDVRMTAALLERMNGVYFQL